MGLSGQFCNFSFKSCPVSLLLRTRSVSMVNPNDDLSLSAAIEATEHLILRELASRVHVGPLPIGIMTPHALPLKEFLVPTYWYHFLFPSLYSQKEQHKFHLETYSKFMKHICLAFSKAQPQYSSHQALPRHHLRCGSKPGQCGCLHGLHQKLDLLPFSDREGS